MILAGVLAGIGLPVRRSYISLLSYGDRICFQLHITFNMAWDCLYFPGSPFGVSCGGL